MLKQSKKVTVFIELYKDNIIMLRNVSNVEINDKSGEVIVYCFRDNKTIRYNFPLEDVVWLEEKISNFLEREQEEGGDA